MEIDDQKHIKELDFETTAQKNCQDDDDDEEEEESMGVDWIQVSGHRGIFRPVKGGRLWKRCVNNSSNESSIYRALSTDPAMTSIAPEYYGERQLNGHYYVEIENLLRHFNNPAIMDIKMGNRTYVESEVRNDAKFNDLYEKMVCIDLNEPAVDEHNDKAITKLRYMQFRENLSSSSTLGFRIDAAKLPGDKKSRNNFQRIKTTQQVTAKLEEFLRGRETTQQQLLLRLIEIRDALGRSTFFRTHELIGSSLLVVYDQRRTGVWMIDFHNTAPTIDGRILTHVDRWQLGNHEDGYLFGLNNLIQILSSIKI